MNLEKLSWVLWSLWYRNLAARGICESLFKPIDSFVFRLQYVSPLECECEYLSPFVVIVGNILDSFLVIRIEMLVTTRVFFPSFSKWRVAYNSCSFFVGEICSESNAWRISKQYPKREINLETFSKIPQIFRIFPLYSVTRGMFVKISGTRFAVCFFARDSRYQRPKWKWLAAQKNNATHDRVDCVCDVLCRCKKATILPFSPFGAYYCSNAENSFQMSSAKSPFSIRKRERVLACSMCTF